MRCGPQKFGPALLKGFGATSMASSASAQRPLYCRATDLVGWVALAFRSRQFLDAEVLFLRRQLALYVERGVKPRRIDAATRVSLALLSRLFAWRSARVVVRPQTLVRWHRAGFRLLWRWKSRPGRPPIPTELRQLIRRVALENPLWVGNGLPTSCW
jgi:putative transposase